MVYIFSRRQTEPNCYVNGEHLTGDISKIYVVTQQSTVCNFEPYLYKIKCVFSLVKVSGNLCTSNLSYFSI